MNIEPGSVARAADKITVAAGGAALWGGWTANEYAAFGGLIFAGLGLAVQIYFKIKDDQRRREADARDREEHAARMAVLARGRDDHG